MAGAGCAVDGGGGGLSRHCERSEAIHVSARGEMDCVVAVAPRNDGGGYFPAPPLLSKNTPCSPNMFQTHQGRFSGTGRP